ncbi:MAG: hypothetical protein Q8K20_09005, partial [Gemmobacter sp.]|nr:hypothetical protein [Gemmobacter sp.]
MDDLRTKRPPVALDKHGSGFPMPKIQRVAIAALALETSDNEAISSLIGIDQKEVGALLHTLLMTGWDIRAAHDELHYKEQAAMTKNEGS